MEKQFVTLNILPKHPHMCDFSLFLQSYSLYMRPADLTWGLSYGIQATISNISTYPSIDPSIHPYVYPTIPLSIHPRLFKYFSISQLSIHLSMHLSMYVFIFTSQSLKIAFRYYFRNYARTFFRNHFQTPKLLSKIFSTWFSKLICNSKLLSKLISKNSKFVLNLKIISKWSDECEC